MIYSGSHFLDVYKCCQTYLVSFYYNSFSTVCFLLYDILRTYLKFCPFWWDETMCPIADRDLYPYPGHRYPSVSLPKVLRSLQDKGLDLRLKCSYEWTIFKWSESECLTTSKDLRIIWSYFSNENFMFCLSINHLNT